MLKNLSCLVLGLSVDPYLTPAVIKKFPNRETNSHFQRKATPHPRKSQLLRSDGATKPSNVKKSAAKELAARSEVAKAPEKPKGPEKAVASGPSTLKPAPVGIRPVDQKSGEKELIEAVSL